MRKFISVVSAALILPSPGVCGTVGHAVVKMYLASGDPGTVLVKGDNTIYITRVACPIQFATCTLALMAMDTVCDLGSETFTIIVKVDGVAVDNGESFTGSYNYCTSGTWIGNFPVSQGRHKILLDTNDNVSANAMQQQWSVNYTVTTP